MRIIGLDDGPFRRNWRRTLLVGVAHEDERPVGVAAEPALVDGLDATDAAARIIERLGGGLVVIDSVTCCGFNVIDGEVLAERLGVGVVHVFLYPLDLDAVRRALSKAGLGLERLGVVEKHWVRARRAECRLGGFWFTAWRVEGFNPCSLQVYSRVPHPLQNAHRVAYALVQALWKRLVE